MPKLLQEKDFIHEEYRKNPRPAWICFFILVVFFVIWWWVAKWREERLEAYQKNSSFLQVTNRELSLFLWSHPEFMRANVKMKADYLTGFKEEDKIRVIPEFAEEYAVAPPEVLFRYHIWKTFLSHHIPDRKITVGEFLEFIQCCKEWHPTFWNGAPKTYKVFVESLNKFEGSQKIAPELLPDSVKQGFIGWKNFYKEGDQINNLLISYDLLDGFLAKYKELARGYWRNILQESTPEYLLEYSNNEYVAKSFVPTHQMASVFKVPFFNEQMTLEENQ